MEKIEIVKRAMLLAAYDVLRPHHQHDFSEEGEFIGLILKSIVACKEAENELIREDQSFAFEDDDVDCFFIAASAYALWLDGLDPVGSLDFATISEKGSNHMFFAKAVHAANLIANIEDAIEVAKEAMMGGRQHDGKLFPPTHRQMQFLKK
jgi:hypothetical protein